MATCAVCGEVLIETTATTLQCPAPQKHAGGSPKIGSAILQCPVKKGAIWVHVFDDAGTGIQLPVTAPGSKRTDGSGFASFDPLGEGEYTVSIDISSLGDDYFPPSNNEIKKVPVRTGEITSVEFRIERVAPLKVSVDLPEGFPGELNIKTTASSGEFNPAHPTEKGKAFVTFPKLRRHDYTVTFQLSEEQKKKYRIEGQRTKPWSLNPSAGNEVKYKVIALKLLKIEAVDGAKGLGDDKYWCLADSVKKVKVRALTEPNDREAWAQLLDWKGTTQTGEMNEALVDITHTGDFTVSATLDCEKSAVIEVYDIVKIDCTLPVASSKYKAYKSDAKTTNLTVTTEPNEKRVWQHLVWSEGTATSDKHECAVALKPVGDRTVTASLEGKPVKVDLHICQWPVLEIAKITFTSHTVLNDGVAEIGTPFDKCWVPGRPAAGPNIPAATAQPPICFTRHTNLKVDSVEFTVKEKPTDQETVSIKGKGGFGELLADVTVKPGDTVVVTGAMTSTGLLPEPVNALDDWEIKWEHLIEDGATWTAAKSSKHMLYLTFLDPLVDVYFTLLDISCRGAVGKTLEPDFLEYSFEPFKAHRGNNNGFPRKGDGVKMTYYKKGYKTKANDTTWTTKGLLSGVHATGRCGGWAELLVHMYKMHGVTPDGQRWYIRSVNPRLTNDNLRFLVKNVNFPLPRTIPAGRYTHVGVETLKQDGEAGQGKLNPQFDFGDHVIVRHKGRYYDPSYGLGYYTSDHAYLTVALCGLGTYENAPYQVLFVGTDGTPQHIPGQCVAYADGFAEYTIVWESLADIANRFSVTDQDLWHEDLALQALRPGGPGTVLLGDTVIVPCDAAGDFDPTGGYNYTITLRELVSFQMIATAHNTTMQDILDDPANVALHGLRGGNPANVVGGDRIIVTAVSAPNSDWVIGHDK